MFEDGKMFDGSSIAGWKGIQESDMILMPDPDTAVIDPFFEEPTLDPALRRHRTQHHAGLRARPALARPPRRGLSEVHRHRRHRLLRPENEFFIFDDIRWGADISGCFYKIDSDEAGWNSERVYEGGNFGHRPASRAAISRCRRSIPCRTSAPPCAWRWRRWASRSKCITTKSPPPASAKSASCSTPW